MIGTQFIRKIKKLGRRNNIEMQYLSQRGKVSHGALFYGSAFTIVRNPKDELKNGNQTFQHINNDTPMGALRRATSNAVGYLSQN
jgi:mRNA interferase HicA